ncbi:MAG: hypothetical protein H0W75_07915 [Chitinophagaceae bacterium]|nr:hypothetical protein [Chitinophagaceae bacterium]
MEIDYHRQSKYSPNKFHVYIEIDMEVIREVTYLEIENVIRDISFVRHQSTDFTFLYGGQFNFEQMLSLPYWDFLFLKGNINQSELEDIQDGCLLIIALFFIEVYDDNGSSYIYTNQLRTKLDDSLNLFQPTTDRQKASIEKIKFLGKYIDNDKVLRRENPDEKSIKIEEEIGQCNQFLYKEFIENYFWETAKAFETNRLDAKERMKNIMDKQKPR